MAERVKTNILFKHCVNTINNRLWKTNKTDFINSSFSTSISTAFTRSDRLELELAQELMCMPLLNYIGLPQRVEELL